MRLRVVRWAIRDPSGLGQAEVDVAAPDGYGETIKRAVGEIDFGNRGPGGYSFFVKAIDDDRDRPGDAAGTPALHTFFVANDRDGDGVLSNADNCPNVANPDQADRDFDGFGDVCDPCPGRNGPQPDADGDGVGDPCDNCPGLRNADQRNTDGDLRGDACDDDDDNDDVADAGEPALGTDPLKRDTDEGGVADGREVENRTDPRNPRDDGTVGAEVIDRFRPDRLLVRFSRDLAKGELERITEDLQLRLRFRSRGSGLYELELPAGADFEQTLKRLNSIQGPSEHGHGAERLAYAVPEFLGVFEWAPSTQAKEGKSVRVVGPGAAKAPSDPRFAAQTGFAELAEAWQVEQGSRDKRGVVVAIIDSGLDVRHEDIQDNLWRNEDEGPGDLNRDGCPGVCRRDDDGDGLSDFSDPDVLELLSRGFTRAQAAADDDENGYIDDLNGYDFAAESANVTDRDGHGTHLAGVVGGVGDNGRGVSGVLWRTQIMPLKVARRQDGLAELPAIARAMRYAGQNGADVILHGYTLTLRNPTEETIANLRALFGRTGTKHIVQVAAAGDRGHDLGRKERRPGLASLISDQGLFLFPVSLGVDTVIAVAAHDEFAAQLAPSSNRGPGVVQMAGPGVNVLSTLPANRYGYRDGSAAAAAYVAGLTGLLINRYPELRNRPLEVVRFLDQRGTLLENPEILTSLHYQFTHPPVLTGTLYDETPFRFPQGFCGSNTYDTDLFDADGDGDLDLLEVNGNPGTGVSNTRLYLNNGGGRFTHAPVANLGTTAQNLNVLEADEGDIDQDGDDDIILASFTPPAPDSNKKEILLLNQGNLQGGTEGTFTAASDELPDNFDVSRDVDFCDFNGDGFPDVFVTNVDGDRVLRNIMTAADKTCLTTSTDCFADMTASWLAGMAVGDGHNSRCVDVDADGDLDVVTMNLNTGGPSGQNVLLINRINEVTAALVNETAVWNLPLEFDTSHGIVAETSTTTMTMPLTEVPATTPTSSSRGGSSARPACPSTTRSWSRPMPPPSFRTLRLAATAYPGGHRPPAQRGGGQHGGGASAG